MTRRARTRGSAYSRRSIATRVASAAPGGPLRAVLPRTLRVAGVLGALTLGSAVCVAIAARARAGELLHDAGASMLSYARADFRDTPRIVHVNGVPLHLMSGHTRDDLPTVLDFFDRRCGAADGGVQRQLAALRSGAGAALDAIDPALLRPVLRNEQPGHGYVACLDLGGAALEPERLAARMRSFAVTFDLARLGALRFVWARAERDGTAYVAVWTEGPLRLDRMFPAEGDVPGVDPSTLPRPPHARRVLSAWQEQHAPLLTAYSVEMPIREAHASYRRALIDGGFAVRERSEESSEQHWLIAMHGAASLVALIRADGPARSSVTLLPLH
jgi:hypothetical protein